MPLPGDHKITSRARALLRRHWIDAGLLTCGSVNGVVYLRGELRRKAVSPAPRVGTADDELACIQALERDLANLEGVKDVILEIQGFECRGDHWERTSSTHKRTGS